MTVNEHDTGRGSFFHRLPRLSTPALVLLGYRAGRCAMTTFSNIAKYSSSTPSTAVSTAVAVAEAAKALSGPVAPPLPSMVHGRTTYYPLSSLRRDQYEVVFLMEGGHEVLGFKLTRRVQGNDFVDRHAFEQAGYFVRREDGGTSELPRSAWPVAWRPQAYAE